MTSFFFFKCLLFFFVFLYSSFIVFHLHAFLSPLQAWQVHCQQQQRQRQMMAKLAGFQRSLAVGVLSLKLTGDRDAQSRGGSS